VLRDSPALGPLPTIVAFDHHRRPGGRGYPAVRRPRPVDVVTSLVAAADIFESLTAKRPYKKGLSAAEAFQVLPRLPEARGLETAARLLFDALSPFPPGTYLELDSGDLAVVTRVSPGNPHLPVVRPLTAHDGRVTFSPDEIDLSSRSKSGHATPNIRRVLPADWDGSPAMLEATAVQDDETRQNERELEARIEDGTLLATEG